MSFFADPSFFVITALIVAIAAVLGLRQVSLRRFGMGATLVMVLFLFCKTPEQGAAFVAFLAIAILAAKSLFARRDSKARFWGALAVTLAPLVVCKVSGIFELNLLGFTGISYLTFKAVQVVLETHDGLIEDMGIGDYLYFLAFFPTIISGPIDRSRRFVEDIHRTPSRDEYAGMLARGILLIGIGMVYKIVIAGIIHRYYNPAGWGSGPAGLELLNQVGIAYLYGFYLFFDFAGYSLMAMGVSYCLGVRTPRNFRAPFIALDIKDFWNRWHMTLSFWLRDFVFMRFARFSMKHKLFKQRLHTAECGFVINMVLMGAWHGLTPSYLLYGLYHGVLLAATEAYQKKSKFHKKHKGERWYQVLSWLITMQLVMFGFALFSGQVLMLAKGV